MNHELKVYWSNIKQIMASKITNFVLKTMHQIKSNEKMLTKLINS